MAVSRRTLLTAAATTAAGLGLAGCNGLSKSSTSGSGSGSGGSSSSAAASPGASASSGGGGGSTPVELEFLNWSSSPTDPEYVGFQKVIDAFHAANPDITVTHKAVPYTSVETTIDARLQAGDPPDIFRVSYIDIGLYSAKDVLYDLSSTFTAAEIKEFIPAFWSAVSYNGKPYGVPHQTDTTAIAYRKDAMAAAGITNLPTSIDDAWTWDEFNANAAKLKKTITAKNQYPFAYDWQQAGAYRWLTWLYEADGTMLDPTRKMGALDSAAGLTALDYTKNFFTQGWVPKNTSVKSTTYTDTAFIAGTVAMSFIGDFLVSEIASGVKFDWAVMPQPKGKSASSDLGGNAVVAAKNGKNPEAAAKFLKFLASAPQMEAFCAVTNELPTLTSLVGADIPYAVDKSLMTTFVQQATTLTPNQVAEVTVPAFGQINTILANGLESVFLSGADPKGALSSMDSLITKAIAAP
jgi:multiple sugar transport system substrate-binding protein